MRDRHRIYLFIDSSLAIESVLENASCVHHRHSRTICACHGGLW